MVVPALIYLDLLFEYMLAACAHAYKLSCKVSNAMRARASTCDATAGSLRRLPPWP